MMQWYQWWEGVKENMKLIFGILNKLRCKLKISIKETIKREEKLREKYIDDIIKMKVNASPTGKQLKCMRFSHTIQETLICI